MIDHQPQAKHVRNYEYASARDWLAPRVANLLTQRSIIATADQVEELMKRHDLKFGGPTDSDAIRQYVDAYAKRIRAA